MPVRDIRSLDIGMLRTFDALMRERSVSRAAARLFLSQPAVSASLNRLRETFGDPLFTRAAHGVVPTARALALASHVEQVLTGVGRLLDADPGFDPAQSERIFRIAGSDHAGALMLPPLARTLQACGSRVRVFWEAASFSTVPARLRRGDFDIAVLARAAPPPEAEGLALYDDDYVLAARHGHPRFRDGASLDSFCDVPQVFLGYGTSALDDLIDQVLARAGRQRHAQVAVTTFSQMADLIAASDFVGVLPQRVARSHAGRVASHGLPIEIAGYRLFLCWDRRSGEDPGVQWLAGQLRQATLPCTDLSAHAQSAGLATTPKDSP